MRFLLDSPPGSSRARAGRFARSAAAALLSASVVLSSACVSTPVAPTPTVRSRPRPPPFPPAKLPVESSDVLTGSSSGVSPGASAGEALGPVVLRGGTVMTAEGHVYASGHLVMDRGVIIAVGDGPGVAPANATVVDVQGKFITPGIIDTHSHMGVYPMPASQGNSDGNEATSPTTGEVWAEHGFWPQDPALPRALAAGVTTIQVLPGSANLIGGRTFTAKLRLGTSAREMRFPGAPQGMKMACGENPKRVHASRGVSTRMGNVAGFRQIFQKATDYRRRWQKHERDLKLWQQRLGDQARRDEDDDRAGKDVERSPLDPPEPPERDFELETLSLVLDGKVLVHNHCYRADEMNVMLDLAAQYGFHIRSFHHALEAYKLRRRLADEQVAVSTWADWWGFKMEAYDGVPQNAALLAAAGARAVIHSDSPREIRQLNQEAGKALAAGRRLGLALDDNEALRWITANAAWALGVDHLTGTLAPGKMADVVVWDRSPFSTYARAERVYLDGALAFDRATPLQQTDFEVGQPELGASSMMPDGASPAAVRPLAIVHARVERGDGTALDDATVLVVDGRIRAVGADVAIPEGAERYDARGKVLTPGIIATNTQTGLLEVAMEKDTVNAELHGALDAVPGFRAVDGYNPLSPRVAIDRAEGITTLVLTPTGKLLRGAGYAVDTAGTLTSLSGARPVASFGGLHGEARAAAGGSVGGMLLRLREVLDDARLYRARRSEVERGDARPLALPPVHLAALGDVLERKIPLVVEAHRAADIHALLELGREQRVRLVINGGAEAWLLAPELARARVPVMLQPSALEPFSFSALRARDDAAAVLRAAGVTVVVTSESTETGTTRTRQEAGIAVAHGLERSAALEAITLAPARVFGLDGERGTVTPGKRADLVVWSGDPLEPSSVAELVLVEGARQPEGTRQRALAEKYRQR